MGTLASSQITLFDYSDGYAVFLSAESISFPGDTAGKVVQNYSRNVEVKGYCGNDEVVVKVGTIVAPTGVSVVTSNNNTIKPQITITVTPAAASSGKLDIPVEIGVISITKQLSYSISAKGEQGIQGIQGPQGVQGIPGETGKTTYFHIKYSAVANPTSSSQMSENPNTYIGTYSDYVENDSTDPSKYKWYRFQGLQGVTGEQGIPGVNGENGQTSYLHIKYSNDGGKTFTTNSGEASGDYIGVYTDFKKDDSTNPADYTWSKIKGEQGIQGLQGVQGEKGEQGIQGVKGANGKTSYFHIKYSSVPSPTSSQMTETPNKYIGTYVDFTEADSTNPSYYHWTQFTGDQGEQGIPGKNGIDGKTYYTHIKYSDDGGQSFTTNNGEDSGAYIGICVDLNENDPVSVGVYKWSKIKGEQGIQGIQGLQGEKGDQGIKGDKGDSGTSSYFHIKYSASANPTSSSQMSETPAKYIGTYVDNNPTDSTDPKKYKWQQLEGSQGAKGDQGLPGTNGVDGKTYYLHIKYSNDGGKTFTANTGETPGDYIGVCTDLNQADPTTVSSYTWSKIKGEKGDQGIQGLQGIQGEKGEQGIQGPKGADGTSSYFHVKYSPVKSPTSAQMTETPDKYIGTYVDNNPTDSTNPNYYHWVQLEGSQGEKGEQGLAGKNGIDGKTYYLHIKYSDDGGKTFTANTGETPGEYIGTCTDLNQADPTTVSSYTWAKIKGEQGIQGIQGPQGLQGVKGADGKTTYFHIKYSTVASPTAAQMTETPSKYIGTYVDYTEADSADPSKYKWAQFQGSQGAKGDQGIAGTNGIDGQTYYLHIKYSNDGGKTFTANTGETVGDYIGTCTDTNKADPTTVASYTWAKIRGETGAAGVGISGVEEYYALSTTTTAPADSAFSTTIPTMTASNKYLWNYEVIKYTNNTTTKSDKKIIGVYGTTGAAGKGISSITNYYLATSASSGVTTATSGWSTTVQATSATNKYLWNYEVIAYTSGNPTTTVPAIIGTHGDKGDKGDKGDTGVSVSSIAEYYALSTTTTAPADSAFSTTIPTMTTTNKYLWNYEKTTFSNGTSSSSSKVIIGVYGSTGAAGAAGRGISKIENFYLVSASGSGITTATTGWSAANPTTVPTTTTTNKYLWNYEKITYTTGTPATETTVPRIISTHGATGATGAAGKGISSVVEKYAVTTSTTAPADSAFSTTIPTMSATNKYLWNLQTITYTDNTATSSGKRIIGVYGATGAAGKGISSITNYYLATASATGVTTGTSGWTTAVQSVSLDKKYLWNYEKITYTDETSTNTTAVVIGVYGDTGMDGFSPFTLTITSSNGTQFKNSNIVTVLTAHVFCGGQELTEKQIKLVGYLQWYISGSSTVAGTGKTLTVNNAANSLDYECRLMVS